MKVKVKDLANALAKIQRLTSGDKQLTGLMLDISGDTLKVGYSDGRKALIETVDAVGEESDVQGKIVLDFPKMLNIVTVAQPSGRLRTDDLELEFKDNNKVNVKVDKFIESGDQLARISTFEQILAWELAGSNQRTSIIARENFDGIFQADSSDTWLVEDLKSILTTMTGEKGKSVYISPKQQQAFVCNTAFTSAYPVKGDYEFPLVLTSDASKYVADILSKLESTEIQVYTIDGKIGKMFTADGKFGLSVELVQANRTHLSQLQRFQEREYTGVQLTFLKEILLNVVRAAIAVGGAVKTNLKLVKDENGIVSLLLDVSNSAASTANAYTVLTSGFAYKAEQGVREEEVLKAFNLPVSLAVIKQIIDKCDSDYITLDVTNGGDNTLIRLAELDVEAHDAMVQKVTGMEATKQEVQAEQVNQEVVENTFETIAVPLPDSAGAFVPNTEIIGSKNETIEFEVDAIDETAVATIVDDTSVDVDLKISFRDETLVGKHYTIAAK